MARSKSTAAASTKVSTKPAAEQSTAKKVTAIEPQTIATTDYKVVIEHCNS